MGSIYVIGALANPEVPEVANKLRSKGFDVFSSWYCASENADIRWQEHEQGRGLTYVEALKDYAAQHVFKFDKLHLDRCDTAVLVYPGGRSAHLELGYAAGKGKKTYILLDKEPAKWDVMLNFANGVFNKLEELINELKKPTILSEPEYLTWHDASNPRVSVRTKNPNYVPPANKLSQKWIKDHWVYCNPAESSYCGICPDCQRMFGNLGRSGGTLK